MMTKAFLILEDGTVFEGKSMGAQKEVISEIVFNTSMTGYLEVLTDPSYAGQAVTMTYPLIGNYGVCYADMESKKGWPDGFIVRELSRMPSNFRSEDSIQHFLEENDIPGIYGIDTRALTKILREKGTMNGMITTNENYDLEEILPKLKDYKVVGVVEKVSCKEKETYKPGDIGSEEVPVERKVVVIDVGTKKNIIRCLLNRGCEVTVYPQNFAAQDVIAEQPDGIMITNGPGDPSGHGRDGRALYPGLCGGAGLLPGSGTDGQEVHTKSPGTGGPRDDLPDRGSGPVWNRRPAGILRTGGLPDQASGVPDRTG